MKRSISSPSKDVVVIGAGPAGLAAAHELAQEGLAPLVLEKSTKPGGIARTEVWDGYRFDIGGHRFFSKNESINRCWKAVLGENLITVPRISRIFYGGHFIKYPLSFLDALFHLGINESILAVLSYLKAQVYPLPEEKTFEQWVSNRFGKRLYEKFFAPYTEKMWGIPCHEIPADWARQRIKGLSLTAAVTDALLGRQRVKSLIQEFYYPVEGPGMMWEQLVKNITANGGRILYNTEVVGVHHSNGRITALQYARNGRTLRVPVDQVISSLPITGLVQMLDPGVPEPVARAGHALTYRSLILVVLILKGENLFPDQWIYIHSPGFRVGRIQNFKNWSRAMVPDPGKTSLGMEYFCGEGDALWNAPDEDISALAVRELENLELAQADWVIESRVLRQPNAYPVYERGYERRLRVIRDFISSFENLQTIGRNGMHRYNNMDHSMLTGMLAAQNTLGTGHHDLWTVNEDAAYLESDKAMASDSEVKQRMLSRSFARMDPVASGTALGFVAGLLCLALTLWTVFLHPALDDFNLWLLAQFFPGFTVSFWGAWVGFFYAFLWGFLFGGSFAGLRNMSLSLYLKGLKRKILKLGAKDFADRI